MGERRNSASPELDIAVRRIDYGYFLRPPEETDTGMARVEPCFGYLVDHPSGTLLFDTGIGVRLDVDLHYQPFRHSVGKALRAVGSCLDEVTVVANCHLHFDHCGGNPLMGSRPVFTQATELASARNTDDYTLPELVDTSAARYEELHGETEILSGVFLTPTPGHTPGHQSLIVCRADGTVIVAGQSHNNASAYGADALAHNVQKRGGSGSVPVTPLWMKRLQDFDPARVVFAHDNAIWEP